jgi:hypothetical protein
MFEHVRIRVSDHEAYELFYETVLRMLGIKQRRSCWPAMRPGTRPWESLTLRRMNTAREGPLTTGEAFAGSSPSHAASPITRVDVAFLSCSRIGLGPKLRHRSIS